MKKGIVIILAVAVIGALGIYAKEHKSDSLTTTPSSSTASTLADNTSASMSTSTASGTYKDGTYTGDAEDTIYGTVQVAAVINGGKIIDIKFLRMPGPEGHSKEVTAFAEDPLKQSTLNHQSANIDFVSGATQTSEGYVQSLQAALDRATMS
jgi:uncharacterized protein with FMN-binding domain